MQDKKKEENSSDESNKKDAPSNAQGFDKSDTRAVIGEILFPMKRGLGMVGKTVRSDSADKVIGADEEEDLSKRDKIASMTVTAGPEDLEKLISEYQSNNR